jgi:hypothetical protein
MARTCRVRPHERRLPPRKIDNALHRQLIREVEDLLFWRKWAELFFAECGVKQNALHRAMAGEAR